MTTTAAAALSPLATRVLAIYDGLAEAECSPVRLSGIRAVFALGMRADRPTDAAVTAALVELADLDGVHVREEANQQTLTPADRAAAVVLGGLPRHNLQVEGRGGDDD